MKPGERKEDKRCRVKEGEGRRGQRAEREIKNTG